MNNLASIRNCLRDEGIFTIARDLVPGHCLLFYFLIIFLSLLKFS